ncbi:MAG: DUF1971 domain-containing protein [Nocardioides sp.]
MAGRRHGKLPEGLGFARETRQFAADDVPSGLLATHRVAEGVWGLLRVHAGPVRYVDEATGAPLDLDAGDEQVIPPGVPHHVEPGPGSRLSVSFYR